MLDRQKKLSVKEAHMRISITKNVNGALVDPPKVLDVEASQGQALIAAGLAEEVPLTSHNVPRAETSTALGGSPIVPRGKPNLKWNILVQDHKPMLRAFCDGCNHKVYMSGPTAHLQAVRHCTEFERRPNNPSLITGKFTEVKETCPRDLAERYIKLFSRWARRMKAMQDTSSRIPTPTPYDVAVATSITQMNGFNQAVKDGKFGVVGDTVEV
jgi:hypothetical protein